MCPDSFYPNFNACLNTFLAIIGTPKTVTITGKNLQPVDGTTSSVVIGGGDCTIQSNSETEIVCEVKT